MFNWLKNKINKIKLDLIKNWLPQIPDKQEILNLAVRRLFCATTDKDVLKEKDDKVFFIDKAMTETEIGLLKEEAKGFQNSRLWRILRTEIEYQANKRMYEMSKSEQDLIAGKMTLFNLDVIKSVLNRISEINH